MNAGGSDASYRLPTDIAESPARTFLVPEVSTPESIAPETTITINYCERGVLSMCANVAAKASSRDPLETVAIALDKAWKAAKGRTAAEQSAGGSALPPAGRLLSRLVRTTSYTLGYGIALPAFLMAELIPEKNSIVDGLLDDARAAPENAEPSNHPQREPPGEPARLLPGKRLSSSSRSRS